MQQKLFKEYEFQLSKSLGFILFAMFGLFSFYGISKALNNAEGLTIRRNFELSTQMATYFWWGTSLLFLLFALFGLMMIVKSFKGPMVITLDDYQITAPKKPISSKMITVKYDEIQKVEVHDIGKVRQLRMKTPYGQMVIPSVNFVKKPEFNEMLSIIQHKVK